jgi:hypothetical protein
MSQLTLRKDVLTSILFPLLAGILALHRFRYHLPVPRTRISFDTVREMGLALPDVEEGTTYGSPALKVHGKMFACLAVHRSADPGSLAIRLDFDQRDELIAADPKTYYLTDHYVNYPIVLVRLSRVRRDALRDLLLMAWRFVSATWKPKPCARATKR